MTIPFKARALCVALATIAGFTVALPAGAQSADSSDSATVSATVRFADLDINQPAGVEVLRGRIRMAAAYVCGGQPDVRQLARTAAFSQCRETTLARSMTIIAGDVGPAWMSASR